MTPIEPFHGSFRLAPAVVPRLCPSRRSGPRVPDPDDTIRVAGGQEISIRAECHAQGTAGMTSERENFFSDGHIPELYRSVDARRGETVSVGTEAHATNVIAMTPKCPGLLTCRSVPDDNSPIAASRCQPGRRGRLGA